MSDDGRTFLIATETASLDTFRGNLATVLSELSAKTGEAFSDGKARFQKAMENHVIRDHCRHIAPASSLGLASSYLTDNPHFQAAVSMGSVGAAYILHGRRLFRGRADELSQDEPLQMLKDEAAAGVCNVTGLVLANLYPEHAGAITFSCAAGAALTLLLVSCATAESENTGDATELETLARRTD